MVRVLLQIEYLMYVGQLVKEKKKNKLNEILKYRFNKKKNINEEIIKYNGNKSQLVFFIDGFKLNGNENILYIKQFILSFYSIKKNEKLPLYIYMLVYMI